MRNDIVAGLEGGRPKVIDVEAYCRFMESKGVPRNISAPPFWRMLVALGIPVAPQLFWKPRAVVVSWTIGITLLMFFIWRSADLVIDEWYDPGYRYIPYGLGYRYWAGAVFGFPAGLSAAFGLRRAAKKLSLTWEECVTEVTKR